MNKKKSSALGINRPLDEQDGILYAIDPVDATNWLDGAEYDEKHGVDLKGSSHLADVYLQYAPEGNDLSILEVGCGSGFLTIGLDAKSRIRQLVAVDISKKFLTQTRDRLPDYPNGRTTLLCGDVADPLLFDNGTFDAAFGNSLLHHIYDTEAFLIALKHAVRPGGSVVFSEPCQQGKSLVSFFCTAMLSAEAGNADTLFSDDEREKISALLEIHKREEAVRHDQSLKLQWEDKHCFDTLELKRLAQKLGFSKFDNFNTSRISDGFRGEVERTLKLMDVTKPLERFAWLFDAFQDEYVSMCEVHVQTPHQFLVFTR